MEHEEAGNVEIRNINFMKLVDGSYLGVYEGGMYKWRENEVQVMVTSGKVSEIALLSSKENRPPEFTEELFNRVIEKQSLQVDVISGASLTSKAFLRSMRIPANPATHSGFILPPEPLRSTSLFIQSQVAGLSQEFRCIFLR